MNQKELIIKIINDNSPELASEEILLMFGITDYHCPECGAETTYDNTIGLYKCNECEWQGQKS